MVNKFDNSDIKRENQIRYMGFETNISIKSKEKLITHVFLYGKTDVVYVSNIFHLKNTVFQSFEVISFIKNKSFSISISTYTEKIILRRNLSSILNKCSIILR
jgi:hypothetical protein